MTSSPLPINCQIRRACPAAAAFTLIELLTVIAIIGILAAILIPTVGKVRQTARQSLCISRARELGSAIQLYSGDHRDQLPFPKDQAGKRWVVYIAPYIGSFTHNYDQYGEISGIKPNDAAIYGHPAVLCPTTPQDVIGTGRGVFGYNVKLNSTFNGSTMRDTPARVADLSAPSWFPVLGTSQPDKSGIQMSYVGPSPRAHDEYGFSGTYTNAGPSPNFGRKAIFLFADWHVAAHDVCNPDAWPWNGKGHQNDSFDVK
ncbi:N-terminal cleavage protein [Opitutaceae bacterium TAV5]|nr:N-terminal cleavage protein [Opitutaceae bacterium TAV5]